MSKALTGSKFLNNPDSSEIYYTSSGTGAVATTVQSKLRETVSVKDFGAAGDGTGRTPADDGVNILTASWNTWDNTPFKTNLPWSPYGTSGSFVPPRAKPFANDDTWDYIGCNLAVWEAARSDKAAYFPSGTYKMNASGSTSKGAYQGLLLMKGQEITMFGDGAHQTIITWKESSTFFASNNYGVIGAYKLFEMYRTGGPPSNIRDMAFIGPDNYEPLAKNITLIDCKNINGVTFRDLWLSACYYGIHADDNSGDSHIKGCTSEYCFGATVDTDATSDFSIDFCNFWASATISGQTGVKALGRASVTNSRLIGFYGAAFNADNGIFSNNYVTGTCAGTPVTFGAGPSVISDNQIVGEAPSCMVSVSSNASVVGNVISNTGPHACLNLGPQTTSSGTATNISVVGNTFIKTDAAVSPDNYAIIAIQDGSSYVGAATASCLIANNTFQGRALFAIRDATFSRNTFDGVLQSAVFTEDMTLAGAVTHTGSSIRQGDVLGKEIMTGSGSTSPFTITVSGMLGQGGGTDRDQRRLNLLAVYTSGPSHVGHAFALYTSEYTGNAILIATLGSSVIGGSIVFGVSGTAPTVTVTNSGGTVNYKINAVPLI